MTSKPPEHPSATEASSIDTPTARLAELALDPILMPLIAANPATSAATLEQLASRQDERLNRAIAGNPNAPLPLLLELAKAFPQEFLTNPAFPFFMMTHPAFVRDISAEAWLSLLRCETIPPSWLCQLQDGRIPITTGHPEIHARMTRRERLDITRKYILDAVRNHVQTSGEIDEHGRSELDQALSISPRDDYQPALYDAITFIALATMTPPLALASIEHTLLAQQEHMKQLSYDDHKKFTELVDTVLTHCPGVTSDLLGRLAKNEDEDIQRIIARHPQTPVVTLEQLAHSSTGHIRWDIARNRNIPVDLFRRLMQDADPFIRHTTTSHPHATIHDLHTLAHDQDAMVRRGVAQLPQLPHDFYRWLAHDQDETVRACVAQNPHTPQMLLKMLAQDQQSDVRACAARNPCLPPETLATLSQEPVERILTSLASNPQLPADLIRNLANNALLQDDLWILAENPQTPSDLLTRWAQTWAQSGDDQLLSLASNPQLPPAILAWLIPYILDDAEVYGDHNADLAGVEIAMHQNTPTDTLASLADQLVQERWDNKFSKTKQRLVSNPRTPLSLSHLQSFLLARSTDAKTALVIASHPLVQQDNSRVLARVLSQRITSPYLPTWFCRFLLTHPALPEALLSSFATSPFWQDRYDVTQHPAVPHTQLLFLARDGNRYVRAAARDALMQAM